MTTPMSTSLIPPEAGAGEIARNEMQSRLAGLGNLGGKKMDPAQKEKKLRESCEGFESIFIQKMWEEMRKTLPKSTLLHGKEEQFWQGMYDQELAKKMTSAGGIGLADMMYAQLSRGLASASRTTATDASGMGQPAFTPEAAPMLTPFNTAESERDGSAAASGNNQASRSAASVYGGVAPTQDAGHVANGSAAARTLTGDQAAADGQDPDEAARLAQQAMQASAQPERHKVVRTSNVPNMNSGLNLARMAQFEAGSKLGSNTVRPSMQQMMGLAQPQNRAGQVSGQNSGQPAGGTGFDQASAPAPMPNLEIPPLMGNNLEAQMAMQAAMQPSQVQAQTQALGQSSGQAQVSGQEQAQAATPTQGQPQKRQTKVRFTTNVPPAGRGGKQGGLIRMLNADGSGPNSNAGAGIAAYHAQQAQQGQPGVTQPAQPAQPAAGSQPAAQVSTLPMGPAGQPAPVVANQSANQPTRQSASPQPTAAGTPMSAQGGTPATAPGMVSPVPLTGGQISVRQSGKNADNHGSTASGIPPLTATDVYGRK